MASTTEADSLHTDLHLKTTSQLLAGINSEDQKVAVAVAQALPQIEKLAECFLQVLQSGGRVFYIGAGTSGRLGVVDASELPPTYGVPFDLVVGLIAGGDGAIRKAVEFAEDDETQAWQDLTAAGAAKGDLVIGIAASGRTPYVIGGLNDAKAQGLYTGAIVCNSGSAVASAAEFPVEVEAGPEFVTGSTRMKAGTAQKLVLNMLSTTAMIRWGRVQGSKMVHMQLSNHKLIDRGVRMIMAELHLPYEIAAAELDKHGSVAATLATLRPEMNKGR